MRREGPVRLLKLSWAWGEPAALQKNLRFALQIELVSRNEAGTALEIGVLIDRQTGSRGPARKRQSRNNQWMTELSGVFRRAKTALKVHNSSPTPSRLLPPRCKLTTVPCCYTTLPTRCSLPLVCSMLGFLLQLP